jgi:hypothetical protein
MNFSAINILLEQAALNVRLAEKLDREDETAESAEIVMRARQFASQVEIYKMRKGGDKT